MTSCKRRRLLKRSKYNKRSKYRSSNSSKCRSEQQELDDEAPANPGHVPVPLNCKTAANTPNAASRSKTSRSKTHSCPWPSPCTSSTAARSERESSGDASYSNWVSQSAKWPTLGPAVHDRSHAYQDERRPGCRLQALQGCFQKWTNMVVRVRALQGYFSKMVQKQGLQ